MKLDTEKPGLSALMKPYKAALFQHLYDLTDPSNYNGMSSGYLWEWLYNNAERLGIEKRSRAMVINVLNELVDEGFLKFKEVTGKGGYQRRYSVAMTIKEFEQHVTEEIVDKLLSIFKLGWEKMEAEAL